MISHVFFPVSLAMIQSNRSYPALINNVNKNVQKEMNEKKIESSTH